MNRPLYYLFLLNIWCAFSTKAQKLDSTATAAPDGFHWQLLTEAKAAMLLPNNWHYKAEKGQGVDAFFLTKEKIVDGGAFQTGVSLNVVQQVKAKTKRQAAEYAQALTARTGRGPNQKVLEEKDVVDGPLHTFMVRYRATPSDAESKIICQWNIANTKTDTFYLLVFESPEKDWPEAWKVGEVMVKELVLSSRQ